ncbi:MULTISPECIES: hypothetical protein [Mammaliicoccus]|uniref:hypothetical protein n=1 Tax=Mammaliicoccus TaxID=2803850 RepID=UPI001EFB3CAC|nr:MULTISPECIES: hypothetical protein [Mammaliicoccus]
MYFLTHKFQIIKEADIIIVKNCISNTALFSFKDTDIDFSIFKKIMYYGKKSDTKDSIESLKMNELINVFPFAFIFTCENRIKSLIIFIRKYNDLILPAIISEYNIERYIQKIEDIIKENKTFDVYLSLDNSLTYLPKLLTEIPFLNIINKKDGYIGSKYDLTISEVDTYEKNNLWSKKSEFVLFVDTSQKNIEIGPLVFTSKFQIPKMKVNKTKSNIKMLQQEELLVFFFLERILYILFFELYDKISGIEFFPTRSSICIDRLNLHGHGKLMTMYPLQDF